MVGLLGTMTAAAVMAGHSFADLCRAGRIITEEG
jgi:hypothetical protein